MTAMAAVLAALAVLHTGSVTPSAEASLTFSDLFGRWKVVKMVGATPITAAQNTARQPLGTMISISASQISTYEGSAGLCKPRKPKITTVDTEAELKNEFGTLVTGLSLPRGAVKPRLPLVDAGCAIALVLDRNTLLWSMSNGFIYIAKRQTGLGHDAPRGR